MSVNAQLAQKTKLSIAGTGGSAKTLSAAVAGFPTILTSTAHGLSNGDVVAIASITGTMGTDATNGLNGKSFVVKNVTANTFCIEANTVGLTYTSGGTATPNAWTQIKEIKGISPSGASVTEIDASDLDSDAMEYKFGLADNGTLSFQIHILESDPGQAAALALFLASGNANFKMESPSKTRTFNGGFLKFPTIPDSTVNGIQTGTAELRVSGAVTVS
jgi:hypothetical protein